MSGRLPGKARYYFIFCKDSDLLEHDSNKINIVRSGGLTLLPNHSLATTGVVVTRGLIYRKFGNIHKEELLKLDKLGTR
jgi:hypothetical protein